MGRMRYVERKGHNERGREREGKKEREKMR